MRVVIQMQVLLYIQVTHLTNTVFWRLNGKWPSSSLPVRTLPHCGSIWYGSKLFSCTSPLSGTWIHNPLQQCYFQLWQTQIKIYWRLQVLSRSFCGVKGIVDTLGRDSASGAQPEMLIIHLPPQMLLGALSFPCSLTSAPNKNGHCPNGVNTAD